MPMPAPIIRIPILPQPAPGPANTLRRHAVTR